MEPPNYLSSSTKTPSLRASSVATNSYLRLIANGNLTSPQAITTILTNALGATDYTDCVKNLRHVDAGIDPQSFIDGLDKVVSHLLFRPPPFTTSLLLGDRDPFTRVRYPRAMRQSPEEGVWNTQAAP